MTRRGLLFLVFALLWNLVIVQSTVFSVNAPSLIGTFVAEGFAWLGPVVPIWRGFSSRQGRQPLLLALILSSAANLLAGLLSIWISFARGEYFAGLTLIFFIPAVGTLLVSCVAYAFNVEGYGG